jgi:transcriptional regulator with XRE-family HTH domain
MDFAKALRVSRAACGVSQQELAKAAGLSPSYVSLIESGKREPTIASMRKLAKALEIPVDLMMLLAIESGDQSKASGQAISQIAQSLLAMLTSGGLTEAHGE